MIAEQTGADTFQIEPVEEYLNTNDNTESSNMDNAASEETEVGQDKADASACRKEDRLCFLLL